MKIFCNSSTDKRRLNDFRFDRVGFDGPSVSNGWATNVGDLDGVTTQSSREGEVRRRSVYEDIDSVGDMGRNVVPESDIGREEVGDMGSSKGVAGLD